MYCNLLSTPRGLAMICAVVLGMLPSISLSAAELHVGVATTSITPDEPVALSGHMRTRIATKVSSPCTASALALETRDGDQVLDQAIMVSCDLIAIRETVLDEVRERVQKLLPDFDVNKIVLNATHTHTAPVMRQHTYALPAEGVMQPTDYVEFLADRVAEIAAKAWESRDIGSVGWGLGHAVVAQNRRVVYKNGSAKMYGNANHPDFRAIEGYEDQDVNVLCFWDKNDKLIGTTVNIACPSQEVEGRPSVDADFWHQVRLSLCAKHGEDLVVLGWTGAAGDQAPRLMYNKAAEERMRKLRGLDRLEEIARRIVNGWEEAYAGASQERHTDVPLVHQVQTVSLPERMVTEQEAERLKAAVAVSAKDPKLFRKMTWQQTVLDRYERQQSGKLTPYQMELHTIRLGDIAIATNDFELFTDFGIQMKARSPALQTFVIQLTGPGFYIPSERAQRGGGYSAIIESNLVGYKGGQVLTDLTVDALKELWTSDSK